MFFDALDYAMRAVTSRSHWPPYSLRAFVDGAQRFGEVAGGLWKSSRGWVYSAVVQRSCIGCGYGRLAYTLATDEALRELEVSYAGMDVDRSSIAWVCQRHITPRNPRFVFYHADCYNFSYNPRGTNATARYRFPHEDSSLNLVLMTSVLTHVLEKHLRHYLAEVSRLLAPGGIAYASFFLYQNAIAFPFSKGHLSLNREDYPTNAVAYDEAFVRSVVRDTGLRVMVPARYGTQDLLRLERPSPSSENF